MTYVQKWGGRVVHAVRSDRIVRNPAGGPGRLRQYVFVCGEVADAFRTEKKPGPATCKECARRGA